MKPIIRMWKVLFSLFLISAVCAREPYAYVYLLPFDNIQNDPAVEWIAAGLTDMVKEEIKNIYGVRIKTKEDLEVTASVTTKGEVQSETLKLSDAKKAYFRNRY